MSGTTSTSSESLGSMFRRSLSRKSSKDANDGSNGQPTKRSSYFSRSRSTSKTSSGDQSDEKKSYGISGLLRLDSTKGKNTSKNSAKSTPTKSTDPDSDSSDAGYYEARNDDVNETSATGDNAEAARLEAEKVEAERKAVEAEAARLEAEKVEDVPETADVKAPESSDAPVDEEKKGEVARKFFSLPLNQLLAIRAVAVDASEQAVATLKQMLVTVQTIRLSSALYIGSAVGLASLVSALAVLGLKKIKSV